MSENPTPPATETEQPAPPGGVNVDSGRDVNVAGDVAGRDVVKNVSTTNVGFGFREVQRLLVTVGALVFVTAACFFSGGVIVGGAAIASLNKPIASNVDAGQAFQAQLDEISNTAPGDRFEITVREVEISSYIKFLVGDQIGLLPESGKVRLLEPGQLVLAGDVRALGGMHAAAVFDVQYNQPGAPFKLTGAMLRLLPVGDSTFGWVWVPPVLLSPLTDSAMGLLAGDFEFTGLRDVSSGEDIAWEVTGVAH